jgi:glutathione S-transferase
MTAILYGNGQSRSFRCLWALNEANIPFAYQGIDRESISEAFIKLSPPMKVPTFTSQDLHISESAAIVNYAGNLSQDRSLIPADVAVRAQYDDICYFVMTELEQPLWTIGKHRFALPEEYRHEVMFDTATFEFDKAQQALAFKLDGGNFAVGDTFTLADVLLAHTLNWAERFKMNLEPAFLDYRDRMYARPACQQSLRQIGA